MHHVLSVGEIYDKAIDLCLRNAGKIALTLGLFSLVGNTFNVLANRSGDDKMLAKLHLRVHGAVLNSGWYTAFGTLTGFVIFPMVEAGLCVLFDGAIRGKPIGLNRFFSSPLRRTGNVIVAAFLSGIYAVVPAFAVAIAYLIVNGVFKQTAVFAVSTVVTLGLVVWLTSMLAFGVAVGFARVALDAGRVVSSLRLGIAKAFDKGNRRRALGVGAPLFILLALGNLGCYFLGVVAFGYTGADAANVVVQSIGDVVSWSFTAAVATICYRNLAPLA